jgi:UDP-N-acetylmuramoyl-L-alanyl-D-glutamate--2,6-diaminopimelate ligase
MNSNQNELRLPTIFPVTCHTNHVGPNSTFVVIKGYNQDGVNYILTALEKGATVIVVQDDVELSPAITQTIAAHDARLERVANTRRALATLSAQALNYPAHKLKIIGITGTKGKTTSSFVLEHVLRSSGHTTALVSTVYNMINGQRFPMNLTTPQPDYLHVFFDLCVQSGVEYVVMEVAAQALSLHRVHGIEFDGIIFTNLDQEHAEFYPTMDEYFAAKSRIFEQCKPNAPHIINADDERCASLSEQHKNSVSFGIMSEKAHLKAEILGSVKDGIQFSATINGQTHTFACPALIGTFNVYNVLGVVGMATKLGIASDAIAHALQTFSKVPGRLEQYHMPNGARCIIDYAHNPSSYQAVLSTLRALTPHLIVVFGCGGNRDKSKRPLMGAIATEIADQVILTSDNPRSEKAEDIIADIKQGIAGEHAHKVLCELDRELAIKKAYALSCDGSIVVMLGKGPDEYQMVGTVKTPFSESGIIKSLGG